MRGRPIGLTAWLLVLTAAEVAGAVLAVRFFVGTRHGQLLDYLALSGTSIGQTRVGGPVGSVLTAISALSLVIATAVVGFIALMRQRIAVAFGAVLLIAGANLTTQLLKLVINRPDLGVDAERAAAGNSAPSGHTTIAASVALALLLVLPARARGVAAVIGAVFAAGVGGATLSAGWHRPSDAVAALLVVGAWGCLAGLAILAVQRRHGGVDYGPGNPVALTLLGAAAVLLLVGAAVALELSDQVLDTPVDELSRRRLFAGYAGGAIEIAGTASLVFALALASAHKVVPQRVPDDDEPAAADGAVPATG